MFISLTTRSPVINFPQNFMKCLMRMFAEEDQGVVFFETVISLKKQKHTCIECVPMPWRQFDLIPGYFKVRTSLLFFSSSKAYKVSGINIVFRG
jgi:Protein similar to CwfJ C-terminus 1